MAQNKVFGRHLRYASAGLDLENKVDVIVSEIVDSQLIGEGILPTMRHASTHLLKVSLG